MRTIVLNVKSRRKSASTLAELGLGPCLERGELVHILTDWSDEIYPLYTYLIRLAIFRPRKSGHSWISCRRLDFVQEIGSSQRRNDG